MTCASLIYYFHRICSVEGRGHSEIWPTGHAIDQPCYDACYVPSGNPVATRLGMKESQIIGGTAAILVMLACLHLTWAARINRHGH